MILHTDKIRKTWWPRNRFREHPTGDDWKQRAPHQPITDHPTELWLFDDWDVYDDEDY